MGKKSVENFQTFYSFYLKASLDSHQNCFQFYKERFNLDDWDKIKKKLINLTRSSNSSRRSLNRRIENASLRAKKKDCVTLTDSLNSFTKETSLANYRLCVICRQFFLNSGAAEITSQDSLYEKLNLEEKKELRRMNSFWICKLCQSDEKERETMLAEPIFRTLNVDGSRILYPSTSDEREQISIDFQDLVLIPKNSFNCKNFKIKDYYLNMYRNECLTNESLSTHYLQRLNKFAQRLWYSDFFEGDISDNNQQKQLSSVSKIHDDSMIRESNAWRRKKKNNISSYFYQFGPCAIAFNIDVHFENLGQTSEGKNGKMFKLLF